MDVTGLPTSPIHSNGKLKGYLEFKAPSVEPGGAKYIRVGSTNHSSYLINLKLIMATFPLVS